ncbi:MAG: hypothetical protein ACHQUC_00045 [Chlamydiales bacterium]
MAAAPRLGPPIEMSGFGFPDSTHFLSEHVTKELFQPNYQELIASLRELEGNIAFPKIYQETVLQPFIEYLEKSLGISEFERIMDTSNDQLDQRDIDLKELIRDVAEALLQRDGRKYPVEALQDLEAFQVIASMLYQATTTSDILYTSPPPLALWTKARELTSLAMTISATQRVHINAEIVCLNPHYRDVGLLAWTTIGPEVAAHHLLGSHEGSIASIKEVVLNQLVNNEAHTQRFSCAKILLMSQYLSERVKGIASDVLSVLNVGPSSSIGLISYLRGIRGGNLKNEGPFLTKTARKLKLTGLDQSLVIDLEVPLDELEGKGVLGYLKGSDDEVLYEQVVYLGDPHPIDLLRPYTMLKIIELLEIDETLKKIWKTFIRKELEKDLKGVAEIRLLRCSLPADITDHPYESIPLDLAVEASEMAAEIIASEPQSTLNGRSLMDLVRWRASDEVCVSQIRNSMASGSPLPSVAISGGVARHIIAATILESMEGGTVISQLFAKMKALLRNLR